MWPSPLSFGASSRCRGCDHPRPRYTGGYASVRSNLGTMLSNAKFTGCEVCAVLSEGILKVLPDRSCDVAREDVDDLRIDFNLAGSRRSLEVLLLQTPITLSFFTSSPTPWLTETMPDLPFGIEVPQSTSSDASLAWAVQQLEACRQSHTACNPDGIAPLPSRVLDVRAPGDSGVRLYESQGEPSAYVCLSHCWGRKPFLRTLSGSLDAHKSEIVWAELPRTFQDAIGFTRKLGIRYLWIDSLCIIQDDRHDWRREAARMASIYQNATLVLSAAKSAGAYGGLYAEMPSRHKVHTVTFDPSQDREDIHGGRNHSHRHTAPQKIHVRQSLTHAHRLLSPYHAPSRTLPTLTRGWILQERFLSRRILHFGPEELSFECLEFSTCQCSPSPTAETGTHARQDTKCDMPGKLEGRGQPAATASEPTWYTNLLTRSARPKMYYSPAAWLTSPAFTDPSHPRELETCWRRLVEDYTLLRLTYDKDVFPAIAGMASQMQRAREARKRGRGDGAAPRYLAGLWEDSLLTGDLLWHVELPPSGASGSGNDGFDIRHRDDSASGDGGHEGWEKTWTCRPPEWRAPSWSWASVKAPVEFIYSEHGVQAECELVSAACDPVGVDPRGELREGGSHLVLKGRLIPARARFVRASTRRGRERRWAGGEEKEEDGEGKEDRGQGDKDGTKEEEPLRPWKVIDLDVLDGGYLKNLWVDDDCRSLVAEEIGEQQQDEEKQPRVYCLLIGRKLPRKELLCLLLARFPRSNSSAPQDGAGLREDGQLYRRIGLLEIFGGPATPKPWGWEHNLRARGADAVVEIV